MPSPPTPQELDAFRAGTDRFIAELDEEFYLHYGGLKERLELEPIYERHADLTELEQAQSLGAAVNGDRGIRELWRFACEGYLGRVTRAHAEKLAALEAELEVTIDGETVPFRMLRPTIANEPDRAKRERIDRVMWETTEEHLNPLYLEAVEETRAALPPLGASTYLELYERFGLKLDDLAAQCRAFLESTESLYEQTVDRALRDLLGIGLDEAKRWDVQRMIRSPQWDESFPGDLMLPALRGTLADLGIDLDSQENVHLDIEQRPSKSPRAFCCPIEVPDKVMLVIQPIGGADDWRALFHEAGHTEHYANTSRDLAVEDKRLGDSAVTEGWAMLLQHLTDEPAWLSRRLDVPRPNEFAAEGMMWLLFFVRRYSAKLLYELEFHGGAPIESMPAPLRRAARRRAQDRAEPGELPGRHRRGLLRPVVPALVGVRGPAARPSAQPLRERVVHLARGRLAAARAVGRGPAPDRGRAAARGLGARGADGSGRRPRPRAPELVRACFTSADSADRPRSRDAHSVHVHREGLFDLLGGYEPCIDERSTWGSWRM